ncbi:MAG: sugar phosphate nucleotidyltransferase [Candidatus Zixiibacteriota bacterium]
MKAVILAGGVGARLRPYTTVLPKPLMPVGNYPIAETLVRQLQHYGVGEITFAVGYLHQLIEAYFGDGSKWGVRIKYLHEEQPLGTAGPLAKIENFREPLLVLNGDILTDLNFSKLYKSHLDSNADITIAAYDKPVKIDLGVLATDGTGSLTDYIEKPEYRFKVSMGIYVFSPSVLEYIPADERFDFPDLVMKLLKVNRGIQTYPFTGLWLDIGRTEDYFNASEVFEDNLLRLLPGCSTADAATRNHAAISP